MSLQQLDIQVVLGDLARAETQVGHGLDGRPVTGALHLATEADTVGLSLVVESAADAAALSRLAARLEHELVAAEAGGPATVGPARRPMSIVNLPPCAEGDDEPAQARAGAGARS